MLSLCTDTTAAMMLSYALGGDNSDGSGCWEWSSSVCYLNREAVEEKRRAVLVWSPATLTVPEKIRHALRRPVSCIVTRHSFSTSPGMLWKVYLCKRRQSYLCHIAELAGFSEGILS
jgi:hypothetical protein